MRPTRRQFLALGGAAAGALSLPGCDTKHAAKVLYARLTPEQELTLGDEEWFATACDACPGGCGLVARVVQQRAVKVEGNPLHPVNRGNSCARGQAVVQALYHPERYHGPQHRTGPRGDGAFTDVAWDDALGAIADQLGPQTLFLSPPLRGHLHWIVERFLGQLNSPHRYTWQPFTTRRQHWAHRAALGDGPLPHYDVASADLVLSFGAPFLETWLSPVHFSRAYGALRQGRPAGRGTVIQVEPRLSTTAANADLWVPARPGTEIALARALADSLTPGASLDVRGVAAACDVPAETIERTARALAAAERPLVLAGGAAAGTTNGAAMVLAALELNRRLARAGKVVPVRPNPPSPLAGLDRFADTGDGTGAAANGFRDLEQLGKRILAGDSSPIAVAILYDTDPLATLPRASAFRRALERIPLVVTIAQTPGATSAAADWILPEHASLERWGTDVPDPAPGAAALTVRQPVIAPLYDTRAAGDILLELARRHGADLPEGGMRELIEADLAALYAHNASVRSRMSATEFRATVLASGGWFAAPELDDWGPAGPSESRVAWLAKPLAAPESGPARFDGAGDEYPYFLMPYESAIWGDRTGGPTPWLAEMGDPMTTVTWDSCVELHPQTAAALGVHAGDLVEVESPHGSVTLPVYLFPAIRPDVVAVGGAAALPVLGTAQDIATGDFAWLATRVRLRPAGLETPLAVLEGTNRWVMGRKGVGDAEHA